VDGRKKTPSCLGFGNLRMSINFEGLKSCACLNMNIAFRVDASKQIGIGHFMRCLTLADALQQHRASIRFVSRYMPVHLSHMLVAKGHEFKLIDGNSTECSIGGLAHAHWLGISQQADAQNTMQVLNDRAWDWLIVDHYGLDFQWEGVFRQTVENILVIDDLADRQHDCDILLDQNLGRSVADYADMVSSDCAVLAGPGYALLRPDFAALRNHSLLRRSKAPQLNHLLITMGGVDEPNATGQVLQALKTCALPTNCRITVVMGLTAPWLVNVQQLAAQMPWLTEVVVNVTDMAQRMADSDLAIGAAGSTSWERCCLGLPTLIVVLADNQKEAAEHLQKAGAANRLAFNGLLHQDLHDQLQCFVDYPEQACQMAACASAITDGLGAERMVTVIANTLNQNI